MEFASAGRQTPFNSYSQSNMSTISFSKDEKAWAHVLGDHQVCSDNATKPLETGKSQLLLAACPAGIDQTHS